MIILKHPVLPCELNLSEDYPTILTIEAPTAFHALLSDLHAQTDNNPGNLELYENYQSLPVAKTMDVVWSPYEMDFAQKKVLGRIYADLDKLSLDDNLSEETGRLQTLLERYFDHLAFNYDIPLTWDDCIATTSLLKAANFTVDTGGLDFVERIILYMHMMAALGVAKVFVWVHLRASLTSKQLLTMYHEMRLQKFCCLFIETTQRKRADPNERHIMLDGDLCEIINDFL